MTYKQIQAAHEARMWLKEVIIPAVGVGAVLYSSPQVREAVKDGFNKAKQTVKSKFKKKGEKES